MQTFKQFLKEGTPAANKAEAKYGIDAYLGSGANASVYANQSPDKLNTVQRVGPNRGAEDLGYRAYAAFLLKYPGLEKNPYLPRIYSIETEDDTVEYQVERLVPFNSPKVGHPDIMWAICENILTDEQYEQVRRDAINSAIRYSTTISEALRDVLAGLLDWLIGKPPKVVQQYIKDHQLVQALNVVHTVIKKHPLLYRDLHPGNIMWRITGTMPQMVLTDPIFQMKE